MNLFEDPMQLELMDLNFSPVEDDSPSASEEFLPDFSMSSLKPFSDCFDPNQAFTIFDDMEPAMLTLVSPNTHQPVNSSFNAYSGLALSEPKSIGLVESFMGHSEYSEFEEAVLKTIKQEPLDELPEDFLIRDDEILNNFIKELCVKEEPQEELPEPSFSTFYQPSHQFDHCYSAPPKSDEEEVMLSPPFSPESSTSSSEIDVVTVPNNHMQLFPRNAEVFRPRNRRGRKPGKSQGRKSNAVRNSRPLNAKALKAAMRKQSYGSSSRRKNTRRINNSVETTPSNSSLSSQSSRCSSDSEETSEKRASHNLAERNRRQELCNLFKDLRRNIPNLKNDAKASKVRILATARTWISTLKLQELHRRSFYKEKTKLTSYANTLKDLCRRVNYDLYYS